MKATICALSVLFWAGLSQAAVVGGQSGSDVSKEEGMARTRQEASPEFETLFSSDTKAAKRAVDFFARQRSSTALCLVLREGQTHQRLDLKVYAAKKLRSMASKEDLPAIVAALEEHNVLVTGSSELQIAHTELNIELVEIIRRITGIPFEGIDAQSQGDLTRVIEKTRAWEKARPKTSPR